MPYYDNFGI